MSGEKRVPEESDMLPEYDFRQGVRGKYAEQYAGRTNLVRLDPDVAEAFPDSIAVNEALRALLRVARQAARKSAAS
jgi:hypothetical protein